MWQRSAEEEEEDGEEVGIAAHVILIVSYLRVPAVVARARLRHARSNLAGSSQTRLRLDVGMLTAQQVE